MPFYFELSHCYSKYKIVSPQPHVLTYKIVSNNSNDISNHGRRV
jgi:hypothetical protein